ncbi:MAG: glycosyltransferase family 4 protein [bacterium]|nr:glycosyltransferase family 4 protein [bacterium]
MKIGIDAREALRPEPRGIGLYIRHLAREFAEIAQDDEFLLYHQLPDELPPERAFDVAPNMRKVRTDIPGGRFHAWERVQMPWRLRRDRLDVYHGTYNTLPPRWRMWPGPPMVVTLHDVIVTYWPDDLQDPFVRYARKVTRRVVRDAALILTVSDWSRRDICERFDCDPEKVRLTYNGLHPAILAGAPDGAGDHARETHADGRPYLFAIGAGLERKNTGRMLECWGQVVAERPDSDHLLLVSGVSKHADRFRERAAQAGVLDRVRFLPYLSQNDLIALYAGAEMTVYPSQIEGWGLPVGESLALGTPVVTSNASAMPEAGGEFARYFDPQSTESMIATLADALDTYPAEFAARRDEAMAFARGFTWRRCAEAVHNAYREAAQT